MGTSRMYARRQRQLAAAEEPKRKEPEIVAHAAPGDEQRMRLTPVIGPGCGGGAIPGSRPGDRTPRGRRP